MSAYTDLRAEMLDWATGTRSHLNEFMALEGNASNRQLTLLQVAKADAAEVARLSAALIALEPVQSSAILFSFPGSHLEGAPNNGRGFNSTIDPIPDGMRVPCVGEEVQLLDPQGEPYAFRVHVVCHQFEPSKDLDPILKPYVYIVLRYGS